MNIDNTNIDKYNNRIDKLINLLNYINQQDEDYSKLKIDKNEFIHNIYYINKLVYKLYEIYNKKISYNKKIGLIKNLKDSNGNKFISKVEAKFILDNLAEPVNNVYQSIYDLRQNALKYNKI